MGASPFKIVGVIVLLLSPLVSSQGYDIVSQGPKNWQESIVVDFINGPNEGLSDWTAKILPLSAERAQTPLGIRWGLLAAVIFNDVRVACVPKSLSYFGTNDTLPPHLCGDVVTEQVIIGYGLSYFYRKQYPPDGYRLTQFMLNLGLTPLSKSMDKNTAVGFGNFVGARVHEYSKNDGWNVLGYPSGLPYLDTTGYKPMNAPGVPEKKLKYPLRWQPLTQTDYFGNFFFQKHVAPHAGLKVEPVLMTRKQLLKRKTKGPYRYPNRRTIHPYDRKMIMRDARKIFAFSRRINKRKIQEALFWDNKYRSTGLVSFYHCFQLLQQGIFKTPKEAGDCSIKAALYEGIAMYDALILGWHEKRRHDIARPQTLIRRVFKKGQRVKAFLGIGRGVGSIEARYWEPMIPAQPHSEYPSGSAMVCTSVFEAQELGLRDLAIEKNRTMPPLMLRTPYSLVPKNPFRDDINFTFSSPRQMAKRCAQSRLWAGVHFSASVRDGQRAVKGIGKMAYEFTEELFNGRVPKNCRHCNVK